MIYIVLNYDKKEVLDISFSYLFANVLRLLYRICYKNVCIIPIDKCKLGYAIVHATSIHDEIYLEYENWKGDDHV